MTDNHRNPVLSIRVGQLTRSQLDNLSAQWGMSLAQVVTTLADRATQQELPMNTRITRTWLEQWLAANRPDLGLYEHNGHKGFYRLDAGPAASFQTCGPTWRDVAAVLEAVESKEPAFNG